MVVREPESDTRGDEPVPVCPNCLAENPTRADYCPQCGMPIGTFAATDPIQSIHTQGWAYRKAAAGAPSRFVFWGMWAIFALLIVGSAGSVVGIAPAATSLADLAAGALIVGLLAVYAIILYRTTRNYVRQCVRRQRCETGCCAECGYDLRGLTETRCPECGAPFRVESGAIGRQG